MCGFLHDICLVCMVLHVFGMEFAFTLTPCLEEGDALVEHPGEALRGSGAGGAGGQCRAGT